MNVIPELCFALPFMTEELRQEWRECETSKDRQRNIDKRTDLFATMLAQFPITETKVLAKQLGISERIISEYASIFGIHKTDELRSEINRRNGDHPKKGHQPDARPVEKVARNGRVVATYRSTVDAADVNGLNRKLVSNSCKKRIHKYRNGYLYRYKEL